MKAFQIVTVLRFKCPTWRFCHLQLRAPSTKLAEITDDFSYSVPGVASRPCCNAATSLGNLNKARKQFEWNASFLGTTLHIQIVFASVPTSKPEETLPTEGFVSNTYLQAQREFGVHCGWLITFGISHGLVHFIMFMYVWIYV